MLVWLNDNAGAVQGVSAVLSVAVTIILAIVTYRYVPLTERISRTSMEQLRASVRPIIAVRFSFGGGNDHGNVYFRDRIIVRIENVGGSPLIVQTVTLGWELFSSPGWVDSEVHGLKGGVLVAGEHRFAEVTMETDEIPAAEHFDAWSDGLTATVDCSDLSGLVAMSYNYNQPSGLWIPSNVSHVTTS